jgi:hypothetical protein
MGNEFAKFALVSGLGLLLGCAGCRSEEQEPLEPLMCYIIGPTVEVSANPQFSEIRASTATPALVIAELEALYVDESFSVNRKLSLKFRPADAAVFERLTHDNIGSRIALVHGADVVAAPKIVEPISADVRVMFPIATNLDATSIYRRLRKLVK